MIESIHHPVHPIQGQVSNCYLILSSDKPILVDTSMSGSQSSIRKALASHGFGFQDLSLILITHADYDHYGSLKSIASLSNAPVAASPLEAASIRLGGSSRPLNHRGIRKWVFRAASRLFAAPPAVVQVEVTPPFAFPAPGWEILATPGHTPGHISLFHSGLGILLCGDSINLAHGRLHPNRGSNCWDERLSEQSFTLQLNLRPRAIYAGHFLIPDNAEKSYS